MAKTDDLEARALDTLLTLAQARGHRVLTPDEADLLYFTEQWLDHNTDGMRAPPQPPGQEQARG